MDKKVNHVGAILGCAFRDIALEKFNSKRIIVNTHWGKQEVLGLQKNDRRSYVIFRHGCPHRLLPHQINYRAQIQALKNLDCSALLVTSSVGVLTPDLPLYRPMLLSDIIMLENRLPDGSPCTMFVSPQPGQGHLVVESGQTGDRLSMFSIPPGFTYGITTRNAISRMDKILP